MGVPKFFRYISERYPCLSELVREGQLPEFDNLYLDMNGIIHNCSHPDDANVHFRISESTIFKEIFHYIDTLFHLIKPRKVFFMAVDGVAPRAKMNQQRGRRFRSIKAAKELEEKAKNAGDALPEEARFDSNCITPGTEFMVRLQEALRYFVKQKISTNTSWQKCRVILSGHETPGEGEHKIMDYIRYLKSQSGYEPNTRHCLYGLDSDLIMLGISTHEINFSLLREEVKFARSSHKSASEDIRFYLLHLGLLREYLELEFDDAKKALEKTANFKFDIEKILDDWLLMGFLVGNDFIPNLPNLHIQENALSLLYKTYMAVLPQLDGYINELGVLNLKRFELFMKELANIDIVLFKLRATDFKNLENSITFDNTDVNDTDIMELVARTSKMMSNKESSSDSDSDSDSGVDITTEFKLQKRHYYIDKLKYEEVTEDVLAEQTECYIRAIQWNLQYYYHGCQSWGWYYPHHYAPYISDIKNFANLDLKFTMGVPFLPFQQLLAVLPSGSQELLPKAYRNLLTNPDSPIYEYYPVNFDTDLNGKNQDWEAVVLIPFIDENRLTAAMNECAHNLTVDERNRNKHEPMLQYEFCSKNQGMYELNGYETLNEVYCTEKRINREDIIVPKDQLVLGAMETALSNVYFPGFPTMKHLKYSGELRAIGVRVFERSSRNETMIINVEPKREYNNVEEIADEYLNKEVFVSWPHLVPARVIAVADENFKISIGNKKDEMNSKEFESLKNDSVEHYNRRMGIALDSNVKYLLYVNIFINHTYTCTSHGGMQLAKTWSNITSTYPEIVTVKDIATPKLTEFKSVAEVFKPNSKVFMLNTMYYGSLGNVIDASLYETCGRIRVSLTYTREPEFTESRSMHASSNEDYMNSYTAGSKIGLRSNVFARITGSIFLYPGKRGPSNEKLQYVNVGLQLKYPKQNLEIPGYTKRDNFTWLYSMKTVEVVNDYYNKFPKLFELLHKQQNGAKDNFYESDLCNDFDMPDGDLLKQIVNFIKKHEYCTIAKRIAGSQTIEKEALQNIVKDVNRLKLQPYKTIVLQVRPGLLYKSDLNYGGYIPDESAVHNLFDRIIIVEDGFTVPLGHKGTIIGIGTLRDANPVRQECINNIENIYLVLFDESFFGGLSVEGVAGNRAFNIRKNVFLNITYGIAKYSDENNNTQIKLCYKLGWNQSQDLSNNDQIFSKFHKNSFKNELNANSNRNAEKISTHNDVVKKKLKDKKIQNDNENIQTESAMKTDILTNLIAFNNSNTNNAKLKDNLNVSDKNAESKNIDSIWNTLKEKGPFLDIWKPSVMFMAKNETITATLPTTTTPTTTTAATMTSAVTTLTESDKCSDVLKKLLKINENSLQTDTTVSTAKIIISSNGNTTATATTNTTTITTTKTQALQDILKLGTVKPSNKINLNRPMHSQIYQHKQFHQQNHPLLQLQQQQQSQHQQQQQQYQQYHQGHQQHNQHIYPQYNHLQQQQYQQQHQNQQLLMQPFQQTRQDYSQHQQQMKQVRGEIEGPHKLSKNGNYADGHGAFIPLQAIKSHSKKKRQQNALKNSLATITTSESEKELTEMSTSPLATQINIDEQVSGKREKSTLLKNNVNLDNQIPVTSLATGFTMTEILSGPPVVDNEKPVANKVRGTIATRPYRNAGISRIAAKFNNTPLMD